MTTRRSTTTSLAEAIQDALDGRSSIIRCPAHEDDQPSLAVSPGSTQPVILNCHAGCLTIDIMLAGGVEWSDVSAPLETHSKPVRGEWTPAGEASHVYDYYDETGTLLFQVLRVPQPGNKKRIMQRRPDPDSKHGHSWNLNGVRRVIWRLPEVIEAVSAGRTIHIAEGEKCVEALLGAIEPGDEATTNPGGAGKWLPEYSEHLRGANVILYADSDEPGRSHMRQVRESLIAVECSVTVKEAPAGVMPNGKSINDVADHLSCGYGLDSLLETTPEQVEKKARTGVDVLDVILRPRGTTEFVLDGTLAKGERVIVVGFEGTGKSMLCRQVAAMTAAGLHPFTGMPLKEPRRVLYIDAENHPDQVQDSWGQLVGLCARHGHPIERDMLTILEEWEVERDLTDANGKAWLLERINAYRPDLVVMGPLTNMAARDLKDDEPVRRLKAAVNEARSVCNSAFWMEHHAPLKSGGDRERPVRPYGSSMFLKWPDYGFGMKPTEDPKVYEWWRNRGLRVRSRQWPEAIREGSGGLEFPWRGGLLQEG